jgi:hypothetical protein
MKATVALCAELKSMLLVPPRHWRRHDRQQVCYVARLLGQQRHGWGAPYQRLIA